MKRRVTSVLAAGLMVCALLLLPAEAGKACMETPNGCLALYKVAVSVVKASVAKEGAVVCSWRQVEGGPSAEGVAPEEESLASRRPVCTLDSGNIDVWGLYDSVDWQECGPMDLETASTLVRYTDHLPSDRTFRMLEAMASRDVPLQYIHMRSMTVYSWSEYFYRVMNSLLDRRTGDFQQSILQSPIGMLGTAKTNHLRFDQMLQDAIVYTAGLTSAISEMTRNRLKLRNGKPPHVVRIGTSKNELKMVKQYEPAGEGTEGEVFVWHGFMSTAEDNPVGWSGPVRWEIDDLAASGADMQLFKTYNQHEREYLLHPYSRLRITGTKQEGNVYVVYAVTTTDPATSAEGR